MGGISCGENGTCRHQEDRCQKGGGEEGGEEGCASQEIGGEESCAKEDGPGSRPTRNGNHRSVELGETPRYSPVIRFALCLTINPKPDRGTRIADRVNVHEDYEVQY